MRLLTIYLILFIQYTLYSQEECRLPFFTGPQQVINDGTWYGHNIVGQTVNVYLERNGSYSPEAAIEEKIKMAEDIIAKANQREQELKSKADALNIEKARIESQKKEQEAKIKINEERQRQK